MLNLPANSQIELQQNSLRRANIFVNSWIVLSWQLDCAIIISVAACFAAWCSVFKMGVLWRLLGCTREIMRGMAVEPQGIKARVFGIAYE